MTTADKPHADPEQEVEQQSKRQDGDGNQARASSNGRATAIFFLATFALLIALVFWPTTKQFIPGLADPPSIRPLGPVLQTRFVGGLAPRTEVSTQGKVLLLRGAVELDAGVAVERRTGVLDDELCVSGTTHCHEIVSR